MIKRLQKKAKRVVFKNRLEAGQKLAKKIKRLKLESPLVLAIAGGGVVVGAQVAEALRCPLKIVVVQKIRYPMESSLGFGAINPRGISFYSSLAEGLPQIIIDSETRKALEKAKSLAKKLARFQKKINFKNQDLILTDDALATGSSAMVAIKSLPCPGPRRIILASPASSQEAIRLLKKTVDRLVVLYHHPKSDPSPVSKPYQEYPKVTQEEIITICQNHG